MKNLANYDDSLPSGNAWSSQENNPTNAYYTTLPAGTTNNNNKNNAYAVVPVAESKSTLEELLDAEDDCFINKRSRMDACSYHYHLAEIIELVQQVDGGNYRPKSNICFVLDYPTFREVFAARYRDRIVHHLVAPYISKVTEAVYCANGNVSHGNRRKYSPQTAALQIQEEMRKHPKGYIVGEDIQGFFMSIDRQVAWEIFCRYERKFTPSGYTEAQRAFIMSTIHSLLLSNPTLDCERRSPDSAWDNIRPEKSLFGNGKGLPIGNFYSQLIANLVLAVIDEVLHASHFVDDYRKIVDTIEEVRAFRAKMHEVASSIGLRVHPKKEYIQPVRHGTKFCGRVIYADRMYISDRSVRACKHKIDLAIHSEISLQSARHLMDCVNSYTGIMCHLQAYNIQKQLIGMVVASGYAEYFDIRNEQNHMIINMKPQFGKRAMSAVAIDNLLKLHHYERSSKKPGIKKCSSYGASRKRMGASPQFRRAERERHVHL